MTKEYVWIADTEANGLLERNRNKDGTWAPAATKVWMFCAYIQHLKQIFIWINDDHYEESVQYCEDHADIVKYFPLSKLPKHMERCDKMIGHNFLKYDEPLWRNVLGIDFDWTKIWDSLLASQLLQPDRLGGNGLANWGRIFGIPKPEHDDWENFSLPMIHRVVEDVKINVKMYEEVQKELMVAKEIKRGVRWDEALRLEFDVAHYIGASERLGFPFNSEYANIIADRITKHIASIDKELDLASVELSFPHPSRVQARDYEDIFLPLVEMYPGTHGTLFPMPDLYDDKSVDIKLFKPITNIFVKSGDYSASIKNWWPEGEDLPDVVGPFTKVRYETLNVDSDPQLKRYLLSLGWSPTEYTKTGLPKITEDSVDAFARDNPNFSRLRERIVSASRLSQIRNRNDDTKGLCNLVREDGCITSENNTMAAATSRSKHKKIVNIPSVDAMWGPLFRRCFNAGRAKTKKWEITEVSRDKYGYINYARDSAGKLLLDSKGKKSPNIITRTVEDRYVLVGCDAQALEMRILGHLMGDPKLIQEVVSGDIHTVFWNTVKDLSSSRGNTKTLEYALIYGSGPANLGSGCDIGRDLIGPDELQALGWWPIKDDWTNAFIDKNGWEPLQFKGAQNTELGKIVTDRFMKGLPALGNLMEVTKREARNYGFLVGIDGRRIKVRKAHAALNTRIQSAGALVMKQALRLAAVRHEEAGIEFRLHCFYHDEFQCGAMPHQADEVGLILKSAIVDAGKHFNMKCPMDAEYKLGGNWENTH